MNWYLPEQLSTHSEKGGNSDCQFSAEVTGSQVAIGVEPAGLKNPAGLWAL